MDGNTSRVDISRSGLIIVDMQNEFVHPEGWFVRLRGRDYQTETIVPNIQRLSLAARNVGRPVIYIQHVLRSDYLDATFPWWKQGPAQSPETKALVEGTWGAQILGDLQPAEGDFIITKKGYCGFTGTMLNGLLRNLQVNTCIMTGVGAAVCVETTVRAGVGLGFQMIVVSDATGPVDHPNLAHLSKFFADVHTTKDVVRLLAQLKVR